MSVKLNSLQAIRNNQHRAMIDNYSLSNLSEGSDTTKTKGRFLSSFQRKLLEQSLATRNLRSEYVRRIKIMLLADEGYSRTEICQMLNCSQETARHWTFVAQTGQAHKWEELSIGRPKRINAEYLARLKELVVNHSPKDCGYSFNRWTANWLSKHLEKELGISISDRHINRLLKNMGLSTRYKASPDKKIKDGELLRSNRITISNLKEINSKENHRAMNSSVSFFDSGRLRSLNSLIFESIEKGSLLEVIM